MKEFFEALNSLWDKIQQFSDVVWENTVDAWTTLNVVSTMLPVGLVGVFLTAIILIIVLRVINR